MPDNPDRNGRRLARSYASRHDTEPRLYLRCEACVGFAVSSARAMIYARIAFTSFAERIFLNEGIPSEAPSRTMAANEASVSFVE
jgi:hypothetical protein